MTDRDKLLLKIPAYLRNELSVEEAKEIEIIAKSDSDFAADIEFQKAIADAFVEAAKPKEDIEFGWARLSREIDSEIRTKKVELANDRHPSRIWQYAAALLAVVAVGQGTLLVLSHGADSQDQYLMAGFSEDAASIWVQPRDGMSMEAMTKYLVESGGTLSGGPDTSGNYKISFENMKACKLAIAENKPFRTAVACQTN